MQFQANVTDDQVRIFTIHAIDDEGVKIDGNHPLAGQTLHFDVEIISIRDATKEEMEHGHVHGPGGHHHH
jgi:FKBP-type peptidyl-prolyl cis-trans isomerase SlyD